MLLLWQRFILFKLNLQIYMKIYDCFMFSDEKMILDIRLNVLNEHVDHFVRIIDDRNLNRNQNKDQTNNKTNPAENNLVEGKEVKQDNIDKEKKE